MKDESRKRGLVAGGAAVATGVATATVGVVPLTVAGLAGTGYLTYRWWKHRAKNIQESESRKMTVLESHWMLVD